MSRNNVFYWRLCVPDKRNILEGMGLHLDENGICDWHRGTWRRHSKPCIVPRVFVTRRGLYRREPRFPEYSGYHGHNPPRTIKRKWERKLRALYRREIQKDPSDPVLSDGEKLLRGWYQWYD